jgi:mannan endo-1,4-beta-mannosidase
VFSRSCAIFDSMNNRLLYLITILLFAFQAKAQSLIDPHATPQTKTLYKNLHTLSKNHILFGHQHATEYGHGWSGDADRSDVKSVTGSHPAIVGIDFMALSGMPDSIIERNKNSLIKQITADYNRGCITTVSWHFSNPVSAGGFYWNDSVSKPAVKYIIPGGSHHDVYKKILSTIADVAKATKAKRNEPVPMIFRPFHEFDGDWFWWGKSHCTAEEFKTLWRFTVSYLRDSLNVHNFIYAFSPDNKFNTEAEFLERYPGNEWVDMVGMDNYGDFGRYGQYDLDAAYKKLKIVSDFAIKNDKLAALTETGLESIPRADWWTEVLLKTLQRGNLRLCYVLVWRNDVKSPTHYYAPFPGHISEKNFIEFYNSPYTLFADDLKKMSFK